MQNILIKQPPVDVAHNHAGTTANAPAQRTTTTAPASEETEMSTEYLLAFGAPPQSTATTTASSGGGSGTKANTVSATRADGTVIEASKVKKFPTEQDVIESIVGPVDWTSETEGYCTCPGIGSHSKKEGTRDCMVYLDHAPTIHCMHSSCRNAVEAKNKELRRAVNELQQGDGSTKKKNLTPEQKQRIRERDEKNSIRLRAKASRKQILKDPWLYADICKDSPVAVQGHEEDHWNCLVQMFPPGDVIWIGGLTPIWRMTISLNDEPGCVQVLPPIEGDIADKIMLFKITKRDMPMPTETAEEFTRAVQALAAELPAFIHYLLNTFEIPAALRSRRFGVTHYHHPDILEGLMEFLSFNPALVWRLSFPSKAQENRRTC